MVGDWRWMLGVSRLAAVLVASNLQYAFDAPTSALSNARFTIGNIIYQGDLANV